MPLLKKAKKKSSFRGVVKGVVGSLRHSHADEDDGDKCMLSYECICNVCVMVHVCVY